MRYIAQNGKWVPENRVKRRRPKRTLHFSIFKGEYNHGLGEYVGSKADVNSACSKIEEQTGSRPVELGNEKPKENPKLQDMTVTREEYEAANA